MAKSFKVASNCPRETHLAFLKDEEEEETAANLLHIYCKKKALW